MDPRTQIRIEATPVNVPDGAVLIVCDDNYQAGLLRSVLLRAGFVSERAGSIGAACEAAKSGRFQVIISTPWFRDGSWKRLADTANRYDLNFEVVLLAPNCDSSVWAGALNDGAFDVLDVMCEQPRAIQTAKRAMWAAYLKGARSTPRCSAGQEAV